MKKALQTIFAIVVLALVACVIMFTCIMAYSGSTTQASDDEASGFSRSTDVIVYDEPQHVLPTYYQTDSAWSETPYLTGTIGTHGCGLVCASMAYGYIFDEEMTPDMVAAEVRDTCSTDGVNDMLKFAEWLSSKSSGGMDLTRVWLLDYVKDYIDEDVLVFVGMSGMLGKTMYSSHVVLMHDMTESGASINDPYDPDNTRRYTWQELDDASFLYYVIVRVS